MIACPICGGATKVTETRSVRSGLRRRRWCLDRACAGRMSTLELPVEFIGGHGQYKASDEDLVVVSRKRLDEVASSMADIAGVRGKSS